MPAALEARLPVDATAVGGGLVALLEALFGPRRAADLLRYLRGASGLSAGRRRRLRAAAAARRIEGAEAALALWEEPYDEPPRDLARSPRGRRAARPAGGAEIAEVASARWPRARPGWSSGPRRRSPTRSASAPSWRAWRRRPRRWRPASRRSRCGPGADPPRTASGSPTPTGCGRPVSTASSSPRCRRASSRAATAAATPSSPSRSASGSACRPRRETEAEERYLFHACLALPRRRLFLAYRDSDEDGAAEARSPLLGEVRRLLDPPPPGGGEPDPVEAGLIRREGPGRGRAPGRRSPFGDRAGAGARGARGRGRRGAAARAGRRRRRGRGAGSAPGSAPPGGPRPPAVPRVRSPTRRCWRRWARSPPTAARRWRASTSAPTAGSSPTSSTRSRSTRRPTRSSRGGSCTPCSSASTRERPGGEAAPRPGSLGAWLARGNELVAEAAAELGAHPAERAIVRRVEGLLGRFLADEASREGSGFEPWLLEAAFGEGEGADRPVLEIDGWGLHGAIDRVDRAADGRALVHDYKLSSRVTAGEKLEEEAKLQLQLYMIAVAEHWEAKPVGGLYHPLRASSVRRPRGAVSAEAAERARRLRPLPDRPDRARRAGGGCSPTRGAAPARSWRGCGAATSGATRGRGPAYATTASAPPSASSRRSAAATGPRSSRSRRRARSGERAAADPRAGRGDRRGPGATSWSRPGPAPARPASWSSATAGWSASTASRPRRCSPSPSPRRRRPSCASGSGRSSSAARRARLGAGGGAAAAARAAPGSTTIHGFCNRLLAAHPVAVGIDPRFRVLDDAEAERAAREAFDEALEEFLPNGDAARERTVAAYEVDGLRAMVRSASTRSFAAAGSPSRACPTPPPPTPPRRWRRRPRRPLRRSRSWEPTDSDRERLERALATLSPSPRPDLDAAGGAANRQQGQVDGAYREAIEAAVGAGRGGRRGRAAYGHVARAAGLFSAPLRGARRSAAPGSTSRTCSCSRCACSSATEIGAAYREPLQPPAGRRVPGHQPPPAAADRGAAGPRHPPDGGRRRAAVDLRLPPRRPRRLPRAAPRDRGRPEAEALPLSGNFRSQPEVIGAVNAIGERLLGDAFRPLRGRRPRPAGRRRDGRGQRGRAAADRRDGLGRRGRRPAPATDARTPPSQPGRGALPRGAAPRAGRRRRRARRRWSSCCAPSPTSTPSRTRSSAPACAPTSSAGAATGPSSRSPTSARLLATIANPLDDQRPARGARLPGLRGRPRHALAAARRGRSRPARSGRRAGGRRRRAPRTSRPSRTGSSASPRATRAPARFRRDAWPDLRRDAGRLPLAGADRRRRDRDRLRPGCPDASPPARPASRTCAS